MINDTDKEKIKIIDRYISSMTLDEIRSEFGAASVVDSLAGQDTTLGPIMSMYSDIHELRNELHSLRNDITSITSILHKLTLPPHELINLKSKYGIY